MEGKFERMVGKGKEGIQRRGVNMKEQIMEKRKIGKNVDGQEGDWEKMDYIYHERRSLKGIESAYVSRGRSRESLD